MARSDVLVTTDWAESNLDAPNTVFVEVDEDTSAYDGGHIAGAVKLDWKTDLQDPIKRDFVDAQQFSKLLSGRSTLSVDSGRPSSSHFLRPPSSSFTSWCP